MNRRWMLTNRVPFSRWIALFALFLFAGLNLQAAPRYTDKETALELAQVLDKGTFRNTLISSTFVQSVDKDHYTIKAVLENGGELNWDLMQIRRWVQNDYLTLSKNRVLVFPDQESSEYVIFDKNKFTQNALKAKVYAKHYEGSDVLAGQTIYYSVIQFNLMNLLNEEPRRDDQGYLHRYVFDLENGQREYLSYLEAWRALKRDALMESAPGSEPLMRTPYELRAINPQKLERLVEGGIGRFGVEMVFDRPVTLKPGHFPFRLYEEPKTSRARLSNPFVIEFTAPNAILLKATKNIRNLEFLYNIRGVNDRRFTRRVLIKANISPEVLATPPEVEVRGEKVLLTFTKVEDQSVYNQSTLQQAELRRRQEQLLAGEITEEDVTRRKLYLRHMEAGMGQVDRGRAQNKFQDRYQTLLGAMANFRSAAINASSDAELSEALRQRNVLARRIPAMIIVYVSGGLKSGGNASEMADLISAGMEMTRDPKLVKQLTSLKKRLP